MSNNFTALVPMKGISERVPDKNIRTLNQKPACHWVLESLSSSDYINEIIVNTDSEKIKDIVSIFEKVNLFCGKRLHAEGLLHQSFLLGSAI